MLPIHSDPRPRVRLSNNTVLLFIKATFRVADGKTKTGFRLWLNGSIILYRREVEIRVILFALEEAESSC